MEIQDIKLTRISSIHSALYSRFVIESDYINKSFILSCPSLNNYLKINGLNSELTTQAKDFMDYFSMPQVNFKSYKQAHKEYVNFLEKTNRHFFSTNDMRIRENYYNFNFKSWQYELTYDDSYNKWWRWHIWKINTSYETNYPKDKIIQTYSKEQALNKLINNYS